MFEELFYFLYRVSRKIKAAKTPALSSYLFVCVLICLNLLTISVVVCYFLNVNLVRDFNVNSTYESLILGSVIMIINYFALYSKRQVILDKYKSQPENVRSKRSILWILYIILSFVLFFIVSANLVK
jgi:succinate dehydrogenase/fumarate reductase cytochrome b subunit